MKVLGGNLRGRKIKAPPGIRPVSQRVKKSCFDIVAGQIEEKLILDLYAGSGSLGIEALSRGAKKVIFIDKNRKNLKLLEENTNILKVTKSCRFYCRDSLLAVKELYLKKILFNLIFLDPPYNKGLLTKSLQLLESYDILARSGCLIGFCHKKEKYNSQYGKISLILERFYGQTSLLIYQKNDE